MLIYSILVYAYFVKFFHYLNSLVRLTLPTEEEVIIWANALTHSVHVGGILIWIEILFLQFTFPVAPLIALLFLQFSRGEIP